MLCKTYLVLLMDSLLDQDLTYGTLKECSKVMLLITEFCSWQQKIVDHVMLNQIIRPDDVKLQLMTVIPVQ